MSSLEERVREEVERLIDPETGLTFGEMNLITSVEEQEPGVLKIEFRPTSSFCPIAFKFAMDIKKAALRVEGVRRAFVYCRGHVMEEAINRMVNES
mgnify:CR=1 FL=1